MKKIFLFSLIAVLCFSQLMAQNKAEDKWVKKQIRSLTLDEKIAQLMIVRAHSNWDVKKVDTIAQLIKKFNIGGLCFFQGGPVREALQTNYFQSIAKTPLLITMDAEWGVGMRLDSVEMFPRQLLLGAIPSDYLIYQMGSAIAAQCKRLGIQVDYAPDVDINNNPDNPVINDRSFGQNRDRVIQHSIAYMKGLQDNGVMATAKHFPGHGDVATDSHLDIPIILKNRAQLDAMELAPFKALIEAGIESVMVGHLSVPAIDSTPKYATSLSAKAVNGLLKNELGFKGISVTDALDMKAISNYFPRGEANVQAILAGNDMLCLPGDIEQSIAKIKEAIQEGRLKTKDIDARVKKILHAKYKHGLAEKQFVDTTNIVADLNKSVGVLKAEMSSAALTYCKSNNLPNLRVGKSVAYIALNQSQPTTITRSLENDFGAKIFFVNSSDSSALVTIKADLAKYEQVIVGLHNYNRRPANKFEIPNFVLQFLNEPHPSNWIHIVLGNPYAVGHFKNISNILFAYEDNEYVQKAVANWLAGKTQATGELSVTVSNELPFGSGYQTKITAHTDNKALASIDSLVQDAISRKAIPGCQVLVAKNNKIVYNKAFGTTAGEGSSPVTLNTYYDLASVTKVSATTVSIMKLVEQGKVDINKTIGDYLPWVAGNEKAKITLKDLLLHQAGLFPYIKFYESLLAPNAVLKESWITSVKDKNHSQFIAPNLYLHNSFTDTIQQQILKSPVTTPGKYVYSDNDFIFLGKIVEQVTGMNLNDYAAQQFYSPLQMKSTGFLPLQKTTLDNIAASELDNYYRHQLIRGSVHDEGASTMGGIAGHAGLYSNATDLATLYLMLLNKGSWEGRKYFNPETVKLYTAYNTEHSRRGLGFDKPEKNNANSKDPYPSASPTSSTFGHTGFTGTCVWADPEKNILYIFLSNRVYPTRDNKAFSELNLRSKIQEAIYAALP